MTSYSNPEERLLSRDEWDVYLKDWLLFLDSDEPSTPKTVDVVIDSGAFRSYYYIPAIYYLANSSRYHIRRIAGASSGALAAVAMVCKIDFAVYIEMYDTIFKYNHNRNLKICDSMEMIFERLLPANAHELCNDKVYVTVTEVMPDGGHRSYPISKFKSRDDLKQILLCSMSLPMLSIYGSCTEYNGCRFIDGLFSVLPAVPFEDNPPPVIFLQIGDLEYPFLWRYTPTDPNIGVLLSRGMRDWEAFIRYTERPDLPYARSSDSQHLFAFEPHLNYFHYANPSEFRSLNGTRNKIQFAILKSMNKVADFRENNPVLVETVRGWMSRWLSKK